MSSVNKAILMGRLGRDPEMRTMPEGAKIANLSVATSESWKDKATGERKSRTEWHRVAIFNEKLAETAERYLAKGAMVYLEGTIQSRKWTDRDGAEKTTTEIVLPRYGGALVLMGKNEGSGNAPSSQAPAAAYGDDDEIPF